MNTITEIQIRKDKLDETRAITRDAVALADGDVLVKVDAFAITANNVTYGVVGDRLGYWKFFPVVEDGWGIVPVWGVGIVEQSTRDDINVGERLYGYWPMASHAILTPAKVSDARFFDGAPHRAELAAVYNNYTRLQNEAGYDPDFDKYRMTLLPLYATSYCLYDFFLDNDWFGAEQIIIPSASSKTAIGTAYAIAEDERKMPLIAITSDRNLATVNALDLYDEVVTYDTVNKINSSIPSALIDMSGNGGIISSLHKILGSEMKYTSMVGVTHFDANKMGPDYIADRSQMFFAPGHIAKRAKEWGRGEFERKAHAFWLRTANQSRSWLTIRTGEGSDDVITAWSEVYAGKTPPSDAWVVGF